MTSLTIVRHGVFETMLPEVVTGFFYEYSAQEDQRDEVWYCHECIHAVGDVPHDDEVDNAAGKDNKDVNYPIDNGPPLAFEVLHRHLTIVTPTENGCEGKSHQTDD